MFARFGFSNYRGVAGSESLSLIAAEPRNKAGPALIEGIGGEYLVTGSAEQSCLPFTILLGLDHRESIVRAMKSLRLQVAHSGGTSAKDATIVDNLFTRKIPDPGRPTVLECDVVIGRTLYSYGFRYDADQYVSEWLWRETGRGRETLFTRDGQDVEYEAEIASEVQDHQPLIGPRRLLLAQAQVKPGLLRTIHWAIRNMHEIVGDADVERMQRQVATQMDRRLIPFLQLFDPTIEDFKKVGSSDRADGQSPTTVIQIARRSSEGSTTATAYRDEPEQLRRWMLVLTWAFAIIDIGGTLVVHEVEAELGSQLACHLLGLFSDWRINWKAAQLIATTSKLGMVNSGIVRPDQINILSRQPDGSLKIRCLPEIGPAPEGPDQSSKCSTSPGSGDLGSLAARLRTKQVEWEPPHFHMEVVGRTRAGKKYWTLRKRWDLFLETVRWRNDHLHLPRETRSRAMREAFARRGAIFR